MPFETAAAQDYEGFYEQEIALSGDDGISAGRTFAGGSAYPVKRKHFWKRRADYLKNFAERAAGEAPIQIIGPASPSIGKINDIYRKVLYLKTEKYDTLVKMKNRLEQYIEINSGYQKIRIQFDFDPDASLKILEKMQEQQVEQ